MNSKNGSYEYIWQYMQKNAGVILGADKNYLIDSRLNPVMRCFNLDDIHALVSLLKKGSEVQLSTAVLDALTTHETYFFRDIKPFEVLENQILPTLIEKRKNLKKLRIWSAACSSGQEIYSIGMILSELLSNNLNWNIELFGTDISQNVINLAEKGIYSDYEVNRGLSELRRDKYFKKTDNRWQITLPDYIRVNFHNFNLMNTYNALGKFDLILLRNVLIYFDLDGKKNILNGMHKVLNSDGYLFLGTAESTTNIVDCFTKNCENEVYYYTK